METTLTKTKWSIDPTHTEIQFKAKHLMITTVTGTLKTFTAEIETEGTDFATAKINFSGDIASITTGNEQRDGHLQGEDFFDSAKFPKLSFVSTALTKESGDEYSLSGNLTIRDVTKPVKLKVELGGIAKDPWGNTKAGLQVSGKINRKDFGLKFHVVNEAGDLLVSDDIKLHAELQLLKA
jgi:polyisoprenoid-binding protein YceI